MSEVRLRPTRPDDLDFVTRLERHPDNRDFVGQWSDAEHRTAIAGDGGREHWLIEADGMRAGYLIAYDCSEHDAGFYVKRLLIADKQRGHGSAALRQFDDRVLAKAGPGACAHKSATVQKAHTGKVMPAPGPKSNRLLAALSAAELKRLRPHLEAVDMPLGHVVYESGRTLEHLYFPTTTLVSLLYVMENGASAEISVVGKDGVVGISLFMGGESTPSRAVVQSAGSALRLPARFLEIEFKRGGSLQHLLLRYTQALITQMAQTAVCNRHHSVDQQLCRWLLLSLDRLQGSDLVMTQELIANMLGVRREGVTAAAGKLQKAGVINYRRGHISVLDRPKLETLSCECYAVVRRECDRLSDYEGVARAFAKPAAR